MLREKSRGGGGGGGMFREGDFFLVGIGEIKIWTKGVLLFNSLRTGTELMSNGLGKDHKNNAKPLRFWGVLLCSLYEKPPPMFILKWH